MAQAARKEKPLAPRKPERAGKKSAFLRDQQALVRLMAQWNAEDAASKHDDKAQWARVKRRLKTTPVSI